MTAQDEKLAAAARAFLREFAGPLAAPVAIRLWTGERVLMKEGIETDLEINVRSPRAFRRLLLKPSLLTFADLMAEGDIDLGDAHPLRMLRSADHLQLMAGVRSISKLTLVRRALPFLLARMPPKENRIAHRGGSAERDDRSLIHFHYDLSNDFYGLFLDPEMVYSSAYFRTPDTSLEEAQRDKLDLICRKLMLRPGERLFDPGCGWGSLVCHAAQHYGVIAHGVTLAKEQFDYCQAKIARLGLSGQVTVELKDCRAITTAGAYDKIAQVEMFEHIGIDNHDAFLTHMRSLLKPRGLYFHQASTRRATRDISKFREKSVYQQFGTTYVFPGGELDHIGLTLTSLERNGFEVHDVENLREHFQKTVEHWADRLWKNRDAAAKLVGWPRTRMWMFYLGLTAVAFERLMLNVFQVTASNRRVGASGLPPTRDHLMGRRG